MMSLWIRLLQSVLLHVCVSNARILQRKSQNHASKRAVEFRKELISALIQGKSFWKDTVFMQTHVAIPNIRLNRDHFHFPVSNDIRSTCKVHLQKLKPIYSCDICGVGICPNPCFQVFKGTIHCKTINMMMKVAMVTSGWKKGEGGRIREEGDLCCAKEQLLCAGGTLNYWFYNP